MIDPAGSLARARGSWLVLPALLLCLASWTSGTPTFLLVAAALLSLVAMAHTTGRRWLGALRVDCFPPRAGLFAGRDAAVSLVATAPTPMRVRLSGPPVGTPVEGIATRDGCRLAARVVPPRRGYWRLTGMEARTHAPFGVTTVTRPIVPKRALVVFPEPLDGFDLPSHLHQPATAPTIASRVPGSGSEILAIRDHGVEDGVRKIYWKGLARTGRLLSRLDEQEEEPALTFVLHLTLADSSPAARDRFERAVSRVTAAVVQAHELRLSYNLVVAGRRTLSGQGERLRNAALAMLATVEPRVGAPHPRFTPATTVLTFGEGLEP